MKDNVFSKQLTEEGLSLRAEGEKQLQLKKLASLDTVLPSKRVEFEIQIIEDRMNQFFKLNSYNPSLELQASEDSNKLNDLKSALFILQKHNL